MRRGWVLIFLFAPICATPAHAQCVDSSEVNNFKVRNVKFRSLFGLVPKELRRQLDAHRGEPYSADRASQYIREIVNFRSNDPTQQKYERLIANKLKLAIKGGQTSLECVEKVEPAECQKTFPGSSQCVDVTLKRYFVEIDALDSSPYLLLFPRRALAALYGAIPRTLLGLNPSFDFTQDRGFGPSIGIDTATDLLDIQEVFGKGEAAPQPLARATPAATPSPSATPDDLEIAFPGEAASIQSSAMGDDRPPDLDESDTKLLLSPRLRKSLNNSFYDTSVRLVLARTKPLQLFQNLALQGGFDASHLPHGHGDFLRNAATLGFATDIRPDGGPIRLINVGGGYRWSRNRYFTGGTGPGEITSENGFETRAVAEGVVGKGFMRAGLWFDGGALNQDRGNYTRVAAVVGYGKDFVIPRKKAFHKIRPPELGGSECWTSSAHDPTKNEATLGVEIVAGLGHAWGDVPEYARFYGGAGAGQFLHAELSEQGLATLPSGPLLRSIGQKKAGLIVAPGGVVRGGTSFKHVNVNISLPIRAWSRPLIPHEWVTTSKLRPDDEEFIGHVPPGETICRDLKSTVKTLVRVSGVNLLVNQQARDMLTDGQKNDLRLRGEDNLTAAEQARLDVAEKALATAKDKIRPEVEHLFAREILPVTNFIADHANIIAVKPLLLADVARLDLSGGDSRTRYAVGGGLQVDVVLARFEFGYVASLNRAPGDSPGNFVGRLILKRFF